FAVPSWRRKHMTLNPASKLLNGVRVLDMTRVLAGPFASMILGDLGAEIVKIENPNLGDDTREWGPPFLGSESAYFVSINRNKKSVAVNIKHEKGADIIKRLVKKSDVLMENYIPGQLERMGYGYDHLKELNTGLIYCSITGYGSDGPYATRPGYDVIASSIAGLTNITGPEDGDPCRVGVAMTDMSTGLFAHGAILAALLQREKTGHGQKIDCNLLSTQVAMLTHLASNYLNAGLEAKRYGTGHASIVPYQSFKTKDQKFLTIGAGNNRHFKKLCQILNLEELTTNKKFVDNKDRVENRIELIGILTEEFRQKTIKEWLDALENCGFPYGPTNNMAEVFSDPQVMHNGMIMEMEHPGCGKNIRIPGPAVRYSTHTYSDAIPPPTLGQ
uniref:Succinyl-CoA:glutarate-CoA transferase n=1 Tax=Ciona savignyi TaxID=51511 RepID=H2ZMF8_CIOSA